MPDLPDIDQQGDVLTESETKLEKPKLFKVLLHNDDFTTMEFVVFVLEYVFNRSEPEAFTIMLKVHNEGLGIAGIYPYDIANMKSEKAMNLARAREFPLLCTIEENRQDAEQETFTTLKSPPRSSGPRVSQKNNWTK
jgi:ATP-dependent Clp protease adaptor protein ClpS